MPQLPPRCWSTAQIRTRSAHENRDRKLRVRARKWFFVLLACELVFSLFSFAGDPVIVKCGFYIISFGSISEVNMVSEAHTCWNDVCGSSRS